MRTLDAVIEEHELGLTWVTREPMRRASHAIVDAGRFWLIDPVDAPEGLERASALGEPAGVVQLLDRHDRDCADTASRLGVPHLRLPEIVPDSPFEVIPVLRMPLWKEAALWWPQRSALIVAETLGTSLSYTADRAEVGIHPLLRLRPPGSVRGMDPRHLLVGHGPSLRGPGTAAAVERAFDRSRAELPHVLRGLPRALRG